jgi:hypothetical protein
MSIINSSLLVGTGCSRRGRSRRFNHNSSTGSVFVDAVVVVVTVVIARVTAARANVDFVTAGGGGVGCRCRVLVIATFLLALLAARVVETYGNLLLCGDGRLGGALVIAVSVTVAGCHHRRDRVIYQGNE